MALDKAIASGKEHRKPYRKAKLVSYACRNHGMCAYCRNNRMLDRQEYHSRLSYNEYQREN